MKTKVCWYKSGMNKHLSDKGFVHFYTKQKINEDFEEGVPYFFDEAKMIFGKCDFVCDLDSANELTKAVMEEILSKKPKTP